MTTAQIDEHARLHARVIELETLVRATEKTLRSIADAMGGRTAAAVLGVADFLRDEMKESTR